MQLIKSMSIYKIKEFSFLLILTGLIALAPTLPIKIIVLFLFTISNFIFQFFDSGTMTFISIAIGLFFQIFSTVELMHAFGHPIIWQIMCFLFLSQALINSGLAYKISIYIMYYMGKSTLSLSFGFCFLTTAFALIIPTSTARIGGIFIPILSSLFEILSKEDEDLKETIIKVIVYSNAIASAMFFTASSGNFYIQEMTKSINVYITAQTWILNGIMPGIVCLILTTLLIHKVMKPSQKNLNKINKKIADEMNGLDSLSTNDWIILTTILGIFPLWAISGKFNIPLLSILFGAISTLLFFDLLTFEENILNHKESWNMFFWMSNLLMLSALITEMKAFSFLSCIPYHVSTILPSQFIFVFILAFYGYSQYLFASSTVHASALYLISFEMCVNYGYNPFVSALILSYISNLFAGLTTYSGSEVLLITKAFDVDPITFNKHGFFISTFVFILWMLCGSIWWKITGVI